MTKYADLFRSAEREAPASAVPGAEPSGDAPDAGVERFTLLFVDDEEPVLSALRRIFLEENYEILTAASADAGIRTLEERKVQLVVTDHRMPGMTGAQFLREVKKRWPDTIRIMLTGYADVQSILGAVNEGAVYKFITKPWNDEDLRLTVSLALQQYVLLQENRRLREIAQRQQSKIKNYAALFDENRAVAGNILLRAGVIRRQDLDEAAKSQQSGEILSETLTRLGAATESAVLKAFQGFLGVEMVDLREMTIHPEVVRFLPRDLCEKNRMLPVRLDGKQVDIAMADPSDIVKCDAIEQITGLKVIPLLARSAEIKEQLRKIYGERAEAEPPEQDGTATFGLDDIFEKEPLDEIDIVIDEDEKPLNINELIGSSKVPPIIRIANAVISEAIRYKASDIHIEPKTKYTLVRFRIDGILHNKIFVPAELHAATISRLKILAKMDIAERRKPQDGRITVKSGTRMVDIRVSMMPTINGEKAVMRILDKRASIRRLDELGVDEGDLGKLNMIIRKPQGMIISTGPTGSGKTTMLYSILSAMLESTRSFETIEDPVEYFLEDANQVYVQEKAGTTFASILRSTLRQDPDVILVGEIRDQETADVAFKGSLTGHMVLTTLHTNNSVASITRMIDMGVKPYLIASALEGILAQRLVRKICPHCRIEEPVNPDTTALLNLPHGLLMESSFRGKGCDRCSQTGYFGRTGVFELFVMNDDFRHHICTGYKESELLSMARSAGMKLLVEDGVGKVRKGETTLEEVLRVIGPQTRHERRCGKCDRVVDAKLPFCPHCGTFKQDACNSCRMPVEPEWTHCAFCGRKGPGSPE
ncbi:MAG: Flp pilus assembly complex ATPase component TadA [Deltaproteobacteria bacterium]|nr:Flp pilus assembly complex ATPase component TadA [Deltaproteobacteria bacterium]